MEQETTAQGEGYRYTFYPCVPMGQVSNALFLAAVAAEAIHGRVQVQLNGRFWADPTDQTATIDAGTKVGQTVARVFTELVSRKLGEQAFSVERVPVPKTYGSAATYGPRTRA